MTTTAEDVIAKTETLALDGGVTAEEDVATEIEPKTGLSFPVKLDEGKLLTCVGLRKKSLLGIGIKIYGFGKYFSIRFSYLLQYLNSVFQGCMQTVGS